MKDKGLVGETEYLHYIGPSLRHIGVKKARHSKGSGGNGKTRIKGSR